MSAQGVESIILDLGYNLNPVGIPTNLVIEVLFLKRDEIFKVPLSKPPFIGITLLRKETVPLLDLKEMIFRDIDYEFEEEYINKDAFILISFQDTQICLKINSIVGYFNLTEVSDGVRSGLREDAYVTEIYHAIEGETDKEVYLLNLDEILSNIKPKEVVSPPTSPDADREIDFSKFDIPDDEDELDIDQFTLPE